MSAELTQDLLNTKLYEELSPGKYIMQVDSAEAKSYTGEKGTFDKIVYKTSVATGKGRGKSVRKEFLVKFTPAEGLPESAAEKPRKAVEIGMRDLRKFVAACGWYSPKDGAKVAGKVEQGLAKYIDENFDSMTSLNGSKFFGTVAMGKPNPKTGQAYTELKGFQDVSAAPVGETADTLVP